MKVRIELAGRVFELSLSKDEPSAETPDDPTTRPPHEVGTPMVVISETPADPIGFRMEQDW